MWASITMNQQGRKICRHGGESVVTYVRMSHPGLGFISLWWWWCGVHCAGVCYLSWLSIMHTYMYVCMCVAVYDMYLMYLMYVCTYSLRLWCVVKHTTTTSFVHCLYGVNYQSDQTTLFPLTLDVTAATHTPAPRRLQLRKAPSHPS